ncbi:hypothetical protein [Micromonospora sp. WMMD737]|uniref:hypothetical protein n=1 Tax=Micromonospora sp. WMMD737 TaxID=3404113 RepID=UPI003B93C131
MDAGAAVEDAARQRWPQAYAGVELHVEANVLAVHRIPSGRALDQAIRGLVPATNVLLVDAVHSERQLTSWQSEVFHDRAYWHSQGIDINGTSTDMGSCVVVAVDSPDRHRAVITAFYPHMPLRIEYGGEAVPLTTAR